MPIALPPYVYAKLRAWLDPMIHVDSEKMKGRTLTDRMTTFKLHSPLRLIIFGKHTAWFLS